MAGYTPVFDSIFTGTLCGKYPDTAAWLYFLALADKHGLVDMTPNYISSVTGMPVDDLTDCIERFMQPDPHSRTADEDGRRLVLIDPDRAWGWRIVNHGKYREKARLQAKSAREIEEGKNAERLRDRRGPPLTAADPLSNTNTNTNTEKKKTGAKSPRPSLDDVIEYCRERGSRVNPEQFVDYYDANGWKVGKNPMKDWKAAVRTWEKRQHEKPNGTSRGPVRIEDTLANLRRIAGEETGGASVDTAGRDVRGQVYDGVFERTE